MIKLTEKCFFSRIFASSLWLLIAMTMSPASGLATIFSISPANGVSFAPNQFTPLFRNGGNTLQVSVGLENLSAIRFELWNACNENQPGANRIAVGSITGRGRQIDRNNLPYGLLTVSLPLTIANPLGNFCAHVIYPVGRDRFSATVFNRGTVARIEVIVDGRATTNVPGGTNATVRFDGASLARSTFYSGIRYPFTRGAVVTNTPQRFDQRVTFNNCGRFEFHPSFLHDAGAPLAAIQVGANRFRGSTRRSITIGQPCQTAPAAPARPPLTSIDCSNPANIGRPACQGGCPPGAKCVR